VSTFERVVTQDGTHSGGQLNKKPRGEGILEPPAEEEPAVWGGAEPWHQPLEKANLGKIEKQI